MPLELTIALGTSRGPIIGLFILEYEFCEGFREGCELDLDYHAYTVVAFAELQLEKLRQAGYPP